MPSQLRPSIMLRRRYRSCVDLPARCVTARSVSTSSPIPNSLTPGDIRSSGDAGELVRRTTVICWSRSTSRAINSVACESLWPKVEAAADALQHCLGDGNLRYAVGPRAFGVDDDPNLVVD